MQSRTKNGFGRTLRRMTPAQNILASKATGLGGRKSHGYRFEEQARNRWLDESRLEEKRLTHETAAGQRIHNLQQTLKRMQTSHDKDRQLLVEMRTAILEKGVDTAGGVASGGGGSGGVTTLTDEACLLHQFTSAGEASAAQFRRGHSEASLANSHTTSPDLMWSLVQQMDDRLEQVERQQSAHAKERQQSAHSEEVVSPPQACPKPVKSARTQAESGGWNPLNNFLSRRARDPASTDTLAA